MLNSKNGVSLIHPASRSGSRAPLKRSRAIGMAGLVLVLLGSSMLFSACIDDDKSFVIMFAVAPEAPPDCTTSVQSLSDAEYMSHGVLDLNFNARTGNPYIPPSYLGRFQVNNYFINTADPDSGRIDANRINLERMEATYSWAKGEDIVQQPGNENLAFLAESPAVVVPVSGVVASAGEADDPGQAIVAGYVIPPDQGNVLLDIPAGSEYSLVLGVHVKVFGTTAGGKAVESNEFVFPVYFCRDCIGCPSGQVYSSCNPGQDQFSCDDPDSGN